MQQELIDSYYHFVREVVAKGVVYCLKDEKEYVASCISSQFTTEDDEEEYLLSGQTKKVPKTANKKNGRGITLVRFL